MQQILFYLSIHDIGCRIVCTLIKLLLRIHTVLGDWAWEDEEIGRWKRGGRGGRGGSKNS
ncbi:hypothetical protein Riv7116_2015 [Rivularia sp. PCC 7116]|nr:hypothetical protein Riv7116_2015 [Rivularia sp. PCC 7116]